VGHPTALELVASTEARAAVARRLTEERYEALYTPQRTASAAASFALLCAGLFAASLFPTVARFLAVEPAWVAVSTLLMSGAAIVSTVAARFGGVLGRPHRIAERVETAVIAGSGATLLFRSGSAASVFWLVPLTQVLLGAPDLLHARYSRFAACAPFVLAGAGFALIGKLSDAVVTTLMILALFYVWNTLARSTRTLLEVQIDKELLQRRLEIMVVEEERRRIARDLHDGLGAELTLLAWAASSSTGAGASDQRLQELSQRARASLHELRRVVSGLKAPDMRVAELGALLEDSCRELVEPVSRFRLEVAGNGTLRGNVCLQVSLVVREAVRNAVTHAAPSSVSVSLDARSELVISVENDGASLPPEAAEKSRGGLSHLRERADLLGGTLFVEPLSAGTRVSLRVPGNAAFVAP